MAAMDTLDLQKILPAMKLAASSATGQDRRFFHALFLLDARLDRAVREASEPIIAQVKLAWWRDRFAEKPENWPNGEPLLEELANWDGEAAGLGALVDGWEVLATGQSLSASDIEGFLGGRSAAWLALARVLQPDIDDRLGGRVDDAARFFALADLKERGVPVPDASSSMPGSLPRLPRRLRPFSVLAALGQRALRKDRPILDGFPALALAMRHGLVGR